MANYQKLDAWKEAMLLVKEVYEITRTFPKEELYGLTSQMKRAAVSIQPISQKEWEGNIERIRYSFCILLVGLFMNWKHY